MKRISLTLLLIPLLCIMAFNQRPNQEMPGQEELKKIDQQLCSLHRVMTNSEYEYRLDTAAPEFSEQLIRHLQNPLTFKYKLDSLSHYIVIRTSADKKIRFYSWDDLTGGTWHSINCLAQFASPNGKPLVQEISGMGLADTSESGDYPDYTDSWIYEVHELAIPSGKFYLTFAGGTHGAGHEHEIVQIFKIAGNKLEKCSSCFADKKDLVIEHLRGEESELEFDPVRKEISYKEFKSDPYEGFYKATGKTIRLKFVNGVFRKQ